MWSLTYWRKNLWNGAACKPILMILEDGPLRSWDKDNVALFDCPVTAVGAQLSKTGTLTLRLDNRKWALVGRGGKFRPARHQNRSVGCSAFDIRIQMHRCRRRWAALASSMRLSTLAAAWHLRIWHNILIDAGAHQN